MGPLYVLDFHFSPAGLERVQNRRRCPYFLSIGNGQKHAKSCFFFSGFQIQRSPHELDQPESDV
jgi:hypothetical protein